MLLLFKIFTFSISDVKLNYIPNSKRTMFVSPLSNSVLAFTNCVYHNSIQGCVRIKSKVFVCDVDVTLPANAIAMNNVSRDVCDCKTGDKVNVDKLSEAEEAKITVLKSVTFSIELFSKRKCNIYETLLIDRIQKIRVPIYAGNKLIVECSGHTFVLTCDKCNPETALLSRDTIVTLIPIPNRLLSIEMDADSKVIDSDINFAEMGIGGLDKQAEDLFRRTMTTRNMDQKLLAELGQTHTKGVLLYGPPGTGKTLIARQLANVLRSVKPIIVNGPELLNKYVGQSEENIRSLFAAAEADQARLGAKSPLHTIIIDEADALFKQRGRDGVASNVNDGMVNQFLSKLDGIYALNNILVFLLTNRKELIDDAVLRPGRVEVHLEISLPDEGGRRQIFNIHLAQLKKTAHLADINLDLIVTNTVNFSGAEIAGVVRSAVSFAAYKSEKVVVTDEHLLRAIKEIIPLYGSDQVNLKRFLTFGFIEWGERLTTLMGTISDNIKAFFTSDRSMTRTIVIRGERFTGKTSIAIQSAFSLDIPYIKLLSMNNFIGSHELSIGSALKHEFVKASKSQRSCIIINDYNYFEKYGTVQQAIEILVNEVYQNKILIIITSFDRVDFVPANFTYEVPMILTDDEAKCVLGVEYEVIAPIGIKELISQNESMSTE